MCTDVFTFKKMRKDELSEMNTFTVLPVLCDHALFHLNNSSFRENISLTDRI